MSRKLSLNKNHGFLIGIQRQLRQQAEELGIPPVNLARPEDHTNPVNCTNPTCATDESGLHVAAQCLQPGMYQEQL